MSEHLIAEANRHAKALDERNDLVVELNLLRQWQREVIQNARGVIKRALLTHHAERKDAIARASHAEAELATLTAERDQLRAEFEKIAVIAAQTQDRNVSLKIERDQLRAELATERARLDHVLKSDWPFRNRDEIDKDIKEAAK